MYVALINLEKDNITTMVVFIFQLPAGVDYPIIKGP